MMQTRCPACGTAFRITAEQLKVRQGQVRCGRCQQIFNALEALVDRPAEAVAHPLETGGAHTPAIAAVEPGAVPTDTLVDVPTESNTSLASPASIVDVSETDTSPVPQDGLGAQDEDGFAEPQVSSEAEAPAADDFGLDDLDLDQALQRVAQELVPGAAKDFPARAPMAAVVEKPAAASADGATAEDVGGADGSDMPGAVPVHVRTMEEAISESAVVAAAKPAVTSVRTPPNIDAALSSVASTTEAAMPLDLPFEAYEKARRQGRRGWLWYSLGMFLLVLLLAQMTLHFRVELGVLIPESRPGFVRVCALVGCELPLPHKPDLLSITSSDLHPQAALPGQFRLLATLRNRAPFAQEYPHLELTLTDIVDQPLLRKVIAPADYLAAGVDRRQGFAAGAELSLQLALKVDARTHAAAGYRLYVFYP